MLEISILKIKTEIGKNCMLTFQLNHEDRKYSNEDQSFFNKNITWNKTKSRFKILIVMNYHSIKRRFYKNRIQILILADESNCSYTLGHANFDLAKIPNNKLLESNETLRIQRCEDKFSQLKVKFKFKFRKIKASNESL